MTEIYKICIHCGIALACNNVHSPQQIPFFILISDDTCQEFRAVIQIKYNKFAFSSTSKYLYASLSCFWYSVFWVAVYYWFVAPVIAADSVSFGCYYYLKIEHRRTQANVTCVFYFVGTLNICCVLAILGPWSDESCCCNHY